MSDETANIRKLAIAAYNLAFELVVEGDQAQLLEGLEQAATSLNLWRKVGTDQNVSIGLWLYSRALAKAGAQALSIEAAAEAVRLAKLDGTDWLIASGYEGLARATQGTASFEANWALAAAAIDAIADAQDRALIASQFADLA
jgi:hypothetical protein